MCVFIKPLTFVIIVIVDPVSLSPLKIINKTRDPELCLSKAFFRVRCKG
jgi:hypothetical protein